MGVSGAAASRQQGSVERLPSGAYRAKIYASIDPHTQRRLYLTETVPAGPKAEKEAQKALTRLRHQVDEQRNPRTRRTLNQLLDEYLKVANLDPGTLRGYQRNRKNHVDPLLGSKQISHVDARVLDDFYAELRRCRKHCDGTAQLEHRTDQPHSCDERCRPHTCESLSTSTIRRIHFLLSGAFKRAVRWGWIALNPCASAEPPAERKPEPQPPTPEQAAQILGAAWEDPDWGAFVWVAMTTGARRDELCALRWTDLDLEQGTINVSRSMDQHGGRTSEKETKTHQHRRIALDPAGGSVSLPAPAVRL